MSDYNARFKDAPWYKKQRVLIGGVGGIGSWLSLLLARGGHELYMFDPDVIEKSNIGGQLYARAQVGMKKVVAVKNNIQHYADTSAGINVFEQPFTEKSPYVPIMFSCFDNMAARKVFFDRWKENLKAAPRNEVQCFIDGRLEAETAIIYCVRTPEEAELWEKEWFPDEKVANAPCTFRATSHNAAIIAGMMTGVFNNVITNFERKMEERIVPYKVNYELPTFTFEAAEVMKTVTY